MMFAPRSSREILGPHLERFAASDYISGPEMVAFLEQTISYLANDPDLLIEIPIEKVSREPWRRSTMQTRSKISDWEAENFTGMKAGGYFRSTSMRA